MDGCTSPLPSRSGQHRSSMTSFDRGLADRKQSKQSWTAHDVGIQQSNRRFIFRVRVKTELITMVHRSALGENAREKPVQNGVEGMGSLLENLDDEGSVGYSSLESIQSKQSTDSDDTDAMIERMLDSSAAKAKANADATLVEQQNEENSVKSSASYDADAMEMEIRELEEEFRQELDRKGKVAVDGIFKNPKSFTGKHNGRLRVHLLGYKGFVAITEPINGRGCNHDRVQEGMLASGGAVLLRKVNSHPVNQVSEAAKLLMQMENQKKDYEIMWTELDTAPRPKASDRSPATRTACAGLEDPAKKEKELREWKEARIAKALALEKRLFKYPILKTAVFDSSKGGFHATVANSSNKRACFLIPFTIKEKKCIVPEIQEALDRDGGVVLKSINGEKIDSKEKGLQLLSRSVNEGSKQMTISWYELDTPALEKDKKRKERKEQKERDEAERKKIKEKEREAERKKIEEKERDEAERKKIKERKTTTNEAQPVTSKKHSALLKKKKDELLKISKALNLKNLTNKNKGQIVTAILSARQDEDASSHGKEDTSDKKNAEYLENRMNQRQKAANEKGELSYLHGMQLNEINSLPWEDVYDLLPPTKGDSTKASKQRRVKRALEQLEKQALIDVSDSKDFQHDLKAMVEHNCPKMAMDLVERRVVEKWSIKNAIAAFRGDPRPTNARVSRNADGTYSIKTVEHSTFHVGSEDDFERTIFVDGKPWFKIKKSNIEGAGFGLFAMRDFDSDVVLGMYCGERMTFKERNLRKDNIYSIEDDGVIYVPQEHKTYMGIHFANSSLCRTTGKKNLFRLSKNTENAAVVKGLIMMSTSVIKDGDEICWPYEFDEKKRKSEDVETNEEDEEDLDDPPKKRARVEPKKPKKSKPSSCINRPRKNPPRGCKK